MDWQALDVIVNAIGMIAVVVTVIYLAVQTRQNTRAIQASVRQAMLSEEINILFKQMENPVIMPFGQDVNNMPDEDIKRTAAFLVAFIRSREGYWLQYKNGMIDEATWLTYKTPMYDLMTSEIGMAVWDLYCKGRGHFNKTFVTEVCEYLDNATIGSLPNIREALGLAEYK